MTRTGTHGRWTVGTHGRWTVGAHGRRDARLME